jgi:hypothetical protein
VEEGRFGQPDFGKKTWLLSAGGNGLDNAMTLK